MAQVLKDDIRERILLAALGEFYKEGFKSATMRRIAGAAGVPAGLIYSYYKNKEELFDAVLRPVRYDWMNVLKAGDASQHSGEKRLSRAETDCILNLFEHRREFIIMMELSEGTAYAGEKEKMISMIEDHLNEHRNSYEADDPVLIHIIANNFVEGLMQIMYHYKDKEWAIMILNKLTEMCFMGIGF